MSGNGEGLVHGLQGGWMQLLPQHDGAMNYVELLSRQCRMPVADT